MSGPVSERIYDKLLTPELEAAGPIEIDVE